MKRVDWKDKSNWEGEEHQHGSIIFPTLLKYKVLSRRIDGRSERMWDISDPGEPRKKMYCLDHPVDFSA